MSVLITVGADIRKDALLIAVSFAGGFLIESWGTHTGLWSYYTGEKPPLWIIPAWPIATLAIERLERIFRTITWKNTRTVDKMVILVDISRFSGLYARFRISHHWHGIYDFRHHWCGAGNQIFR